MMEGPLSRRIVLRVLSTSILLVLLFSQHALNVVPLPSVETTSTSSYINELLGGRSSVFVVSENVSRTVITRQEQDQRNATSAVFLLSSSNNNYKRNKRKNILLDPWILSRSQHFNSWFIHNDGMGLLKERVDMIANYGPILDFVIAGWPKCGTTTLEANLGKYAPMPIGDICTPVHQTVYYAYINWPRENDNVTHPTKPLRGTKCPQFASDLRPFTQYLPRTKIILGIRHPVSWFQSFWNMQAISEYVRAWEPMDLKVFRCDCFVIDNSPYTFRIPIYNSRNKTTTNQFIHHYSDNRWYLTASPYNFTSPCKPGGRCRLDCPDKQLFCTARANFHLGLAQLGKTPLTTDERKWLATHLFYGGHNVPNHNITNDVFVYDTSQLANDAVWDDLAEFLNLPEVEHDLYHGSQAQQLKEWGRAAQIDICKPAYDDLRRDLMAIAYQMSVWLVDYFLPVAHDPNRPDVRVADPRSFSQAVTSYREDPCRRLIRYHKDGTWQLMTNATDAENSTEGAASMR